MAAGEVESSYVHIWNCEFCGNVNEIHLAPEELPNRDTIDYLLEGAPEVNMNVQDETAVIFCIDVSGSMNTATVLAKGKKSMSSSPRILS
jgi:hypothetical protein